MTTMDLSILNLFKAGRVTRETALTFCMDYDHMVQKL